MEGNVVKKQPFYDASNENEAVRLLILHNDEINTFDHVINSLIQICRHDSAQAEQCAFLTHYKGKCDIKSGTYPELAPMRSALLDRGLQVTID
jgi:ATP-dependent Clp protease adaptor protein ClpS